MSLVVHPYADAFPMMSDDALDALADDIKANGLQHPIIRDKDGMLVDGRNRLAACERAGVKPRFETLRADVDPVAYITSANVKRRQMTKGQIAIVAARALLDSNNQEAVAASVGVSQAMLGQAAVIVEFAPDLADRVLAGNLPFDAAYRPAKDRRRDEREQIAHDAELRAQAPDLAEMVTEETLTFDEAWAAYDKRTEDVRREQSEHAAAVRRQADRVMAFLDGVDAASGLGDNPMRDDVLNQLGDHDRDRFLRIEKELAWPTTGI